MLASRVSSASRRSSRPSSTGYRGRTSRAGIAPVERLEDRRLFAATGAIGTQPIEITPTPIVVGTPVDLINRPRQVLNDNLGSSAETDTFRVFLRQNEFLAVD